MAGPSFSGVYSLAAYAVLFYIIWIVGYELFLHPLNKYPGPFLLRLTRLPLAYQTLRGRAPFYAASLFDKYGPVVRLGPNTLGYVDGAGWKDIYGHRPGGHFEKPIESYRQTPKGPINILNSDHEEHAKLRKWIAPSFSDRAMQEQEPMIGGYVDLLMTRLGERCEGGSKALNLRNWYTFATFDIIGKLAFSSDFGCLESSGFHPWVQMVSFSIKENTYLGELKRLGLLPLVFLLSKTVLAKGRRGHLNNTTEMLKKRIEAGKQPDLMEEIINNKEGIEIEWDRLHSNASLLVIAGSETTATLLCGVTYLLLANPECLRKVVEEVRSSFSKSEEITLTSVNRLTYMLACLNEAFRCYPPVAGVLPRRVVEGDAVIGGKTVPKGTIVGTWHYPMYQSTTNFALPKEFHPERFLGDPRFANDNLNCLQPFSVGPRDCVGRNLSYAEMRLIIARIVFNFDLKLADDSRDWIERQKCYAIWDKLDLNVHLTPISH